MQKDFEVKKRARDERVAELEDQAQEIKAQLATTEHLMGQFKAAIAKNREDVSRLRFIGSIFIDSFAFRMKE